jgi:hypothetical protein
MGAALCIAVIAPKGGATAIESWCRARWVHALLCICTVLPNALLLLLLLLWL